jgi:hypothetical protein
MTETIYISLGGDCAISYHLQQHNLRFASFPFDWIISPRIDHCLRGDFRHLFDPLLYTEKTQKFQFQAIDEDWMEYDDKIEKKECCRIVHSLYKFTFLHERNVEDIIPKYKRRVDRFLQVMRDSTIHKKIFRMSADVSEEHTLPSVFKECGYINYDFYYKRMPSDIDWKKENFGWKEWFGL